jgi:hypothetical protein
MKMKNTTTIFFMIMGLVFFTGCGATRNAAVDGSSDSTDDWDAAGDQVDGINDPSGDEGGEPDVVGECVPGDVRCGIDGIRERCSDAAEWENDPCSDSEACVDDGLCLPTVCERGETRCDPTDSTRVEICNETHTGWTLSVVCSGDSVCEYGVCVPQSCEPGTILCTSDGQMRECNETGTGYGDPVDCEDGTICDGDECVPVICTPGEAECVDLERRRICNFLGTGYDPEDCPEGTSCTGGECIEHICEPLSKRCDPSDPLAWQQCNASGTEWGPSTACPDGQGCSDGRCLTQVCEPGSSMCAPGGLIRTCSDSGTEWNDPVPCPTGQACDGGTCMNIICTPGESTCVDAATVRVCNDTGTRYVEEPCGDGYVCEGTTCRLQICLPRLRQCSGPASIEECNSAGTAWVPAGTCNASMGEVCFEGACLTLCQQAETADSSIGCRFYGIDLDQADELSADSSPYAIVVSNTHDTLTASVSVQDRVGGAWRSRASTTIAPNSLYTFRLTPDQHVEDTNRMNGYAYKITSNIPVVAYQFNPIDSASQYSNDASLLLPYHALGPLYYVSSWKHLAVANYRGYITVVGVQDGTSVTARVTTSTVAGGGIPAMSSGGTYTATLNENDALQIATASAQLDLTGTRVTASGPVAVFGGTECADVPQNCSWCRTASGGTLPSSHGTYTCAWCDHVEEQMFPVNTWGQSYIAARVPVRSTGTAVEAGYWRVIASENNTTVTIDRASGITLRFPSGVTPPYRINEGQYLEFEMVGPTATPGDALITADRPIMLVQYIEGQECTNRGAGDGGDPAMILMVPQEQYLSEYIFLTPNTYALDYVVVVRQTGATITLDGAAIPSSAFINVTSNYQVARRSLTDGVHNIYGTSPFGIIGVGYSPYVSYGYMGGLALRVINPG